MPSLLLILLVLGLVGLLIMVVSWCGMAYMHWLAVRYVPLRSESRVASSRRLHHDRRQ